MTQYWQIKWSQSSFSNLGSLYFYKKRLETSCTCKDEVMQQLLPNEFNQKEVGKSHKYKIIRQIKNSTNNKIFQAKDERYNDMQLAVKVEPQNTQSARLIHQCNIYRILRPEKGVDYRIRIPHFYYCATQDCFNVFVIQKMGPSLHDILQQTGKLSLDQVLHLAEQMISIIQYIHSKHVLHRDLHPSNFCMGTNQNSNNIFLIDFGLAKRYIFRDNQHIILKKVGSLIGNMTYASINAHNRVQQSRRDDLESLAYIIIDMAKGGLPWNREQNVREFEIAEMKKKTRASQLCKDLPICFGIFLETVKKLEFSQEPNYEFFKNLFRLTFKCQDLDKPSLSFPSNLRQINDCN